MKKKLRPPAIREILGKFDDFCGYNTELGRQARKELDKLREAIKLLKNGSSDDAACSSIVEEVEAWIQ